MKHPEAANTGVKPDQDSNGQDDTLFGRAMKAYIDAVEAGTPLNREELLSRFPQIADDLRAALDGLEFIEHVAPQLSETPGGPDTKFASHLPAKGVLGDFRILREIGRGGMGVVYEAEQISLGRRVALKVLPFAGVMDQRQLARFKTEAQAAALLQHQNIVPVHYVGSDRGVHFYAMQYIEGLPLSEVIQQLRTLAGLEREGERDNEDFQLASRLMSGEGPSNFGVKGLASTRGDANPAPAGPSGTSPSASAETVPLAHLSTDRSTRSPQYYRSIAQLGIQAAEALDHAHKNGVLHRDVKPANLLLDTTGNLWVTDFGLARMDSGATLTMTGDLLGTLRYMSPEQALAKRVVVDHRSDIYSLGVTLYELLSLQPAYAGEDRQRLLKQIAFEEPRPLRKVNPAIPVDLETIVSKAIAKNPDERYETAEELAADLRRYLDHRPILAKRPSLVQLGAKWVRRHAGLVATAAVVLVVLQVALGSFTWILAQKQREVVEQRNESILQRDLAETNYAQAINNLSLASGVTDDLFLLAMERSALPHLGERLSRDAVVERMVDSYASLTSQPRPDPAIRAIQGRGFLRLADLYSQLGKPDRQKEAQQKALEVFESIVRDVPEEPAYALNLATAHLTIGGEEHCTRAVSILRTLPADRPSASASREASTEHQHPISFLDWQCGCFGQYRYMLAFALDHLAEAVAESEEAEQSLREAAELWTTLIAEFPDRQRHLIGAGNNAKALGTIVEAAGRPAEAGRWYAAADEHLRQALKLNPDSTVVLRSHAELLAHLDRHGKALNRWKKLMELFPEEEVYRREYWARYWSGEQLQRDGETYLAQLERALALAPQSASRLNNFARTLVTYPDARLHEPARAVRLASQAVTLEPDMASYWSTLASSHQAVGDWNAAFDAQEHALDLEQTATYQHNLALMLAHCPEMEGRDIPRALQLAEESVADRPDLAHCWSILGQARYRSGDFSGAIAALTKADGLNLSRRARNDFFLAMAHWKVGEKAKARSFYQRADAFMRSHHPLGAGFAQEYFRDEAAELLGIATEQSTSQATLYGGIARSSSFSSLPPATLVTLDSSDGIVRTVSNVSPRPGLMGISGIAFNFAGELFATCSSRDKQTKGIDPVPPTLIQIDREMGALKQIVGVVRTANGNVVKISDLAIQPETDTLFGIGSIGHGSPGTSQTARLFTIDSATAIATLVGDAGLSFGGGLAFAPDGKLYQSSFRNRTQPWVQRVIGIFQLDPATGQEIGFIELKGEEGFSSNRYVLPGLAIRRSDGAMFATGSVLSGPRNEGEGINNLLAQIDLETGTIRHIGPPGQGIGEKMGDIAFWDPAAKAETADIP